MHSFDLNALVREAVHAAMVDHVRQRLTDLFRDVLSDEALCAQLEGALFAAFGRAATKRQRARKPKP